MGCSPQGQPGTAAAAGHGLGSWRGQRGAGLSCGERQQRMGICWAVSEHRRALPAPRHPGWEGPRCPLHCGRHRPCSGSGAGFSDRSGVAAAPNSSCSPAKGTPLPGIWGGCLLPGGESRGTAPSPVAVPVPIQVMRALPRLGRGTRPGRHRVLYERSPCRGSWLQPSPTTVWTHRTIAL